MITPPKFKDRQVLVIGDIILDQYLFGEVSRLSPEAPVPILKKSGEEYVLGGAANVANNLAALGAIPRLCGVVGNDDRKEIIFQLLQKNRIKDGGIVVDESRPTTLKTRFVTRGHQLLRVDDEQVANLRLELEDELFEKFAHALKDCEVVIMSDYDKGCFSPALGRRLIEAGKIAGKIMVADFKPKNKSVFAGVNLITPNLKEAEVMTGRNSVAEMGKSLVSQFGSDVLITQGELGMTLFTQDGRSKYLPARKVQVFDINGAGDSVVAVVALALAAGAGLEKAAVLANLAGEIVVQKSGTATLSLEELESALAGQPDLEGLPIVAKVWGFEKWLENNSQYCCKLLSLNKGYQCSLHYHKRKDEMFLVIKGHVRLEVAQEITHLRAGNYMRIPPGTVHRFGGMEDSEIIEVSTHHDENDSFRLEPSRKMEVYE